MLKEAKLKLAGVLALCVLGLFGCASVDQKAVPGQLKQIDVFAQVKVDERVIKAGNEFGFDLLKKINAEQTTNNLLISPLSLSSALSMTYNGAAGATQKEMAQTLRYGVLSLYQIKAANLALRSNLLTAIPNSDPRIQLKIANSLWAKKGVNFDRTFLMIGKNIYGAKTTSLDLSTPAAANAMNAWVKESTSGKIEKMFNEPPGGPLVLLNAVYFKGKWQNEFAVSETKTAPFHLQNGGEKQVPMMSRKGHYAYAKAKNCAIIDLPYGEGDLNLRLVLPDENVSLNALISQISTPQWDDWKSAMVSQEGTVSIPRFKMEFEIGLNDSLRAMGMKSAFSRDADFSKMRPQKDLFISQVKHKAVIEVNEEGTEAAAATSVGMLGSAMIKPFEFIADRPFLGAIYDVHSGAILFEMIVREP